MSNYRTKIPAEISADSLVLSNDRPTCKAVTQAADGLDFSIAGATGEHGTNPGDAGSNAEPMSIHDRQSQHIFLKNTQGKEPCIIKFKPAYEGAPTIGELSLESWYGESIDPNKGAPTTGHRNTPCFFIKQRLASAEATAGTVYGVNARGWHTALCIDDDGEMYTNAHMPNKDNLYDLGYASMRWDDVFATNNTIQTSDRELKSDIQPLSMGLSFVKTLKPVSYKWKESKGAEGKREHWGLVAQDVFDSLQASGVECGEDERGLKQSKAALFCADWTGKTDDETGLKPDKRYGLRYGELISSLVLSIQELSKQVDELKGAAAEAPASKRKRTA